MDPPKEGRNRSRSFRPIAPAVPNGTLLPILPPPCAHLDANVSGRAGRAAVLVVTVLILATAGTSPGRAQGWTRCDGSLGTMPEAQGWTLIVDIDPVAPDVVGVAGGDLHLSTLGLAATGSTGGGVHWMRTDVPVDFSGDFAVEQDLQIVSAPDGSVNTANGWPRPGYQLEVMDIHQKVFWVGFGSGQVFLSNDVYGQYGSANTITACFNTTDRHRLYRIQRAAGGVGASLLIDGVPVLTLNSLGPTYRGGPFVMFGDGTCWANSESHTAFVRCAASEAGVGPSPSAAWLVAAPVRNPASELKLGFRA